MKVIFPHGYRLKHWAACLCVLFSTFSAYPTNVVNWTNVFFGINGWTLAIPVIKPSISNTNIFLTWSTDPNYALQDTSDLANGFGGFSSSHTNGTLTSSTYPITGNKHFFRLYGPTAWIPAFSFAIFYNSSLEFTWAAPMIINGPIHANGPIYTGISSASSLTFNSTVTTTSAISKIGEGGYLLSNMTGTVTYGGSPAFATNVNVITPFPVSTTNSAIALVDPPPPGEDPNSMLGKYRIYNRAGIIVLVSNLTVQVAVMHSFGDTSPYVIVTDSSDSNLKQVLPFITLTNTFFDQRENKTTKVSQIDLLVLQHWIQTNNAILLSPIRPENILYVADRRTVTSSQLACVRLVNATNLPDLFAVHFGVGFTLATPNPLYIQGNYNCPNLADLNTTTTTNSIPSALISDSLTILSPAWSDSKSTASLSSRNTPAPITINAGIITGIVYTTGTDSSTFSGGVHNLPRLLEPWTVSINVTINGSLVNLYASRFATNQFQVPGNYYNAPSRQFNFDPRFLDPGQQPPGTPLLNVFPSRNY